jgi:hypothetical protein
MVSILSIESFALFSSPQHAAAAAAEQESCSSQVGKKGLKKSGTELSLLDLLSPFPARRDVLLTIGDGEEEKEEASREPSSSSETQPAAVVLGPEHNRVRSVRGEGAGPQADHIRLPFDSGKFGVPEQSSACTSDGARLTATRSRVLIVPGVSRTRTMNNGRNRVVGVPPKEESRGVSAQILAPLRSRRREVLFPGRTTTTTTSAVEIHRRASQIHARSSASFSQISPHATSTTSTPAITPTKRKPIAMSSPASSITKSPQGRRSSRSIAIKNPHTSSSGYYSVGMNNSQSELLAAEEDSISNERMYDWATWRMYNRIVDHRRKNQQFSSSSRGGSSMMNNNASMMMDPSSIFALGGSMNAPPRGSADYIHEGEVFELDI